MPRLVEFKLHLPGAGRPQGLTFGQGSESGEYVRRATPANDFSEHLDKTFAFPNLLLEAIQLPQLSEVEQRALKSETPRESWRYNVRSHRCGAQDLPHRDCRSSPKE